MKRLLLFLLTSSALAQGDLDESRLFPERLSVLRLGMGWAELAVARTNATDNSGSFPGRGPMDANQPGWCAVEMFRDSWFETADYVFGALWGKADELVKVDLHGPRNGLAVPFELIEGETISRLGPPLSRKTVYVPASGADVLIWADGETVVCLARIFSMFGEPVTRPMASLGIARRWTYNEKQSFFRNLLDPDFKTTPERPLFLFPDLPATNRPVACEMLADSRHFTVPPDLCGFLLIRLDGYRDFDIRLPTPSEGGLLSRKQGASWFLLTTAEDVPSFAISADADLVGGLDGDIGYVIPEERRRAIRGIIDQIKKSGE